MMIINGMKGLGDNIYQRAFIKQLPLGVWLETPWPELYKDIPDINLILPVTRLRTQMKNICRQPKGTWQRRPRGTVVQVGYGREGIFPGMMRSFARTPGEMDLPDFGPSPVDGRYVVIRPATVRSEWRADTRNPLPEYIAQAATEMRRRGYKVVSVADLVEGREWALDPLPVADLQFHRGELPVDHLLALVQGAAAVIGGIGWLLPAAIAAKVQALIICGGQGGYNAPELITSKAMDVSRIEFVVPDNFCRCTQKEHNCDKRISNYAERLTAWASRLPAVVG
nr:hypothetical protein [Pseudomonas aeruginosa]